MLPLQILYPATFPWMRPQVMLQSEGKPYPQRHCSPLDGNLCLLGRDTGQWDPEWTAVKLLEMQLADALNDTGIEDPQGEPMEFWWNTTAVAPSYCLIDSAFDPGGADGGTLKLACRLRKKHPLDFVASVIEARSLAGMVLTSMPNPHSDGFEDTIIVPWVNLKETFTPDVNDPSLGLETLLQAHPRLMPVRPQRLSGGRELCIVAVSYPMEIGYRKTGYGWLFLHRTKEKTRGTTRGSSASIIRTLRAGSADLLNRNPEAASLRGKRITLFGAGSLGGPIALELAKNGCAELRLVDHDIVEPGNSVRWPLGATAWGYEKIEALRLFIEENYPSCSVVKHLCHIGYGVFDDKITSQAIEGADLIVDATASVRVTQWLSDLCPMVGLPLVSAYATPHAAGGLAGGASSLFVPGSGCRRCLEWAWCQGEIERPPGQDTSDSLVQPPGCSERTFEGAGYDVQEVSLQAIRMAVAALAQSDGKTSTVATLRFDRNHGAFALPIWRRDDLQRHPQCGCNSGR